MVVETTDGKKRVETATIPKLMINRFRLRTDEMVVQCSRVMVMVAFVKNGRRLVPGWVTHLQVADCGLSVVRCGRVQYNVIMERQA